MLQYYLILSCETVFHIAVVNLIGGLDLHYLVVIHKAITLWFSCLHGLIQTLGNVLRVKKSSQNHSPSARVSRVFLNPRSRNIPRVWIKPLIRVLSTSKNYKLRASKK